MTPIERLLVVPLGEDPERSAAAALKVELAPLGAAVGASGLGGSGLRAALEATCSPFVLFALPDQPVDAEGIATTLRGLEGAPEAVLGSAGLVWRPAALSLDISTRERRRSGGSVHEGRRLARLLALQAVLFPSWNGVVWRAAALGTDLPRRLDAEPLLAPAPTDAEPLLAPAPTDAEPLAAGAFLASLALEVLVRGSAWTGEHLAYSRRSAALVAGDVVAWGEALAMAEELALLDQEGDFERAVVNLTHEAKRAHLDRLLPVLDGAARRAAGRR
ncbi:MAG TPA: hypothetical protein VMD59_15245, partial [Acidimicrobiales bacterium]|nr:hypothetical protein [Acidimicrobiales bacterium]